jgi:hypothetical protein
MGSQKDTDMQLVKNLTILDKKRENNRTYYYCECSICNNRKWIRADGFKDCKSCGCMSKANYFKAKDLTGLRFDRLLVLEKTDKRDKHNGSIIWKCMCDCGNIKMVEGNSLQNKNKKCLTRSCGCLAKEVHNKSIQKAVNIHISEHIVQGTNIQTLRIPLHSNNTSGYKGVCWDKRRELWRVQIEFKGKRYYLGRYKNKEDAIKARQEADIKYHQNFLEWYDEQKKKEVNKNDK